MKTKEIITEAFDSLLSAELIREPDTTLKQVNFKLVCPTCKARHSFTFNTALEAKEREINLWINNMIAEFYYKHILNCTGETIWKGKYLKKL